jgi:hypothetical protein
MNPDNADIENRGCAAESLRGSERQWREVFETGLLSGNGRRVGHDQQ